MSSEDQPTLDNANDRATERHRRVVRRIAFVIAAKLILVVANVWMAFDSGVPQGIRSLGVSLQIALTGIFLVLLFQLTNPPRR